jgi:CheY-like chemotaxis protein
VPRVLVVDDDPLVCGTIEVCLQREGFDVTVADGGEAGMKALETSSFDVMLVDIFMPHMRGCQAIRVFHERAPDIPLIAMSGYAFANLDSPSHDFLTMTLELGATRCPRKPFTPGRAAGRDQRLSEQADGSGASLALAASLGSRRQHHAG